MLDGRAKIGSILEQRLVSTSSPNLPSGIPLGKEVSYPKGYDASLLFPIARLDARRTLGLQSVVQAATSAAADLPFKGFDLWNAYELSWLNSKGLPKVALLHLKVPCTSPHIIESKSFKLYLNSFNQTRFETVHHVFDHLRQDLARATGAEIDLELIGPDQFSNEKIDEFSGINLDKLDIEIDCYAPNAALLKLKNPAPSEAEKVRVSERVFSRLLKSNCPVTDQPDWACLQIEYTGPAIDHASLLQYIVSYRMHSGFHEHCVEKIFIDIMKQCKPQSLSIYARYTRRGGLDINPWRATPDAEPPFGGRSARQ